VNESIVFATYLGMAAVFVRALATLWFVVYDFLRGRRDER